MKTPSQQSLGKYFSQKAAWRTLLTLLCLTVPTHNLSANETLNRLQDIQIGEKGAFTRIAVFCRTDCQITTRSDGFFIADIQDNLSINLKKISNNAQKITMIPTDNGSLLSIKSQNTALRSSVSTCRMQNISAKCIDLEFSAAPIERLAQPAPAISTTRAIKTKRNNAKTAIKPSSTALTNDVPITKHDLELRNPDSAGTQSKAGPSITVANANSTPQTSKQSETLGNIRPGTQNPALIAVKSPINTPSKQKELQLRSPVLRSVETKKILTRIEFRQEAENIINTRFDLNTCNNAQKELQADAWALDAMADIGFCKGAEGKFAEAETIFKRLLTLDQNNTNANIGRALIARTSGEESIAKRFFQDALATSPENSVKLRLSNILSGL